MATKNSSKRNGAAETVRGAKALTSLSRNMKNTAALAATSAAVINARLTDVNCGELARMGPEKAVAALSAGNAWMFAAWRMAAAFYRNMAEEAAAGFTAAREIAATPFPLIPLLQYQAASVSRATSRGSAAAEALLQTQRDLLRPYTSAAGANLRRLAKR